MKATFFILTIIVSFIVFTEKAYGVLVICQEEADCPGEHSACPTVGAPCVCDDGYHENTEETDCVADIAAGVTCTVADSEAECVDYAQCQNVAEAQDDPVLQCTCMSGYLLSSGACKGGSGSECAVNEDCVESATCEEDDMSELKCQCSEGHHEMANQGGINACEADIALDGACTLKDEETECIDNAVCHMMDDESLLCKCNGGFHQSSGACVADIAAGETCTVVESDEECVDHAQCQSVAVGQEQQLQCTCVSGYLLSSGACKAGAGTACMTLGDTGLCMEGSACQNTAADGEADEDLKCVCSEGWHEEVESVSLTICVEDHGAGETCPEEDSSSVCVEHATCRNTQTVAGQPDDLKCTCDPEYEQAKDEPDEHVCVSDKCQHTVDRCKTAGTSTCEEVTAFIECMLTGDCAADDADELTLFHNELDTVKTSIPEDCEVTDPTTCPQQVSSCLLQHLKSNTICTTIGVLQTCLTPVICTDGDDVHVNALIQALVTALSDTLSCACVNAVDDCRNPQTAILDDQDSDATAKCNAVKALFMCAIESECDVSQEVDLQKVSQAWSLAMASATDHDCKDTITNEADTCSLQLTRCALIFGEDRNTDPDHKLTECRAAESFAQCLDEHTEDCTGDGDDDLKKLFTDQSDIVNNGCECEQQLNRCYNAAGEDISSDEAEDACPKLEDFAVCLTGVQCNPNEDHSSVRQAYDWFKELKTQKSCSFGKDGTCKMDVVACVDSFIAGVPEGNILCPAVTDNTYCLMAARCIDVEDGDSDIVETFQRGTTLITTALSCSVPTGCTSSFADVSECQSDFVADTADAGSDAKKKCTAKNDMVKCLRDPRCNIHLKELIEDTYKELKADNDEDECDLLPLESGTASVQGSLLTVLGCAAVIMVTNHIWDRF